MSVDARDSNGNGGGDGALVCFFLCQGQVKAKGMKGELLGRFGRHYLGGGTDEGLRQEV